MARKRLDEPQLANWGDVEKSLFQIGCINRVIASEEAAANTRIDQAKQLLKESTDPLLEKKAALELQIKEFCETKRAEFKETRSRTFIFGTVSFRKSSKLVIKKTAATLAKLKELGLAQFIRISETIDRETLRSQADELLQKIGAKIETDDVFGYEIDQAKVNEKLEVA